MLENILVENVVSGSENIKQACEYYVESRSVLKLAGMNLRQWTCNNSEVNQLAEKENVQGPPAVHVLGVKWDSVKDEIGLTEFVPSTQKKWTKRKIFGDIARVFDPYGWLSPVTIAAKLFVQELWK